MTKTLISTIRRKRYFTLIELLANTARFTGDLAQIFKVGEMRDER